MGGNPQNEQHDPYPWMSQDTTKKPVVLKDSAPNPKLSTGALGGPSLAVLIVWVFKCAGVDVPVEVALSMAALLVLLVGYFTPGRVD